MSNTTNKVKAAELERRVSLLRKQIVTTLKDGVIVTFSGGMDSAFLLWITEMLRKEAGGKLLALTTISSSMPGKDRQDAKEFTDNLEIEHIWKHSGEIEQLEYARNDFNRCYYCKNELFRIAEAVAKSENCRWIMYGYNASDKCDVRPGHRAAMEHEILFPLAEAGLTKDDIRSIMRKNGLKLSEKPASPCLSSRVMHGVTITSQLLEDIEHMESLLLKGGLKIFRVRLCEEKQLNSKFLRLEVDPSEIPRVLALRDTIVVEGKRRGYRWVTLDLEGYRMGGGRL